MSRRRRGAVGLRDVLSCRAFGGALIGRMLQVVRVKLIVPARRAMPFHKSDDDSTLVLRCEKYNHDLPPDDRVVWAEALLRCRKPG